MDTDRFDTLTRTIAPLLSRRGLAGLGLLTLAGLGFTGDASAGKKRKKHKRKKKGQNCSGCPACQQSDNGLACGGSGVCINGVCAQTCDPNGDGCAGSAGCTTRKAEDGSVCVPDSGDPCLNTDCADDADCPSGEACVSLLCIDFPKGHCTPVITAGWPAASLVDANGIWALVVSTWANAVVNISPNSAFTGSINGSNQPNNCAGPGQFNGTCG